jgi:hypothetical protein
MTRGSVAALRLAVAAFGLPSEHVVPVGGLSSARSAELVDACEQDGILGLLGEAVRGGTLALPDDARANLELRMRARAAQDLAVERALLGLCGALTAAAIEWRAIGAPALARTAYPRPELRSLDRAQVLVDAADRDRARALVDASSATQGEVEVLHDERTDLFAPPYRFPLGGFELATLPMPHRLLVLCGEHDGEASPPVAHLRDVAEVVVREQPNLVDVLLLARAWGREAKLASTLVTTWAALALTEAPALVTWARTR